MQASQATNETRLPRAVLKRSAAIEDRIKARTEPKTDPADPNAPPAEPSAQAATTGDPTPPPQPPADPRESDPAYWKQRFNVTAGVLNKERGERRAEQEGFNRRLTELQEQVRTLQANATPPADASIDLGQFFTAEQVQALGEDECRTMAATALKAAQTTVRSAIDAEIKPLRDRQAADAAQAVTDRKTQFVDKLAELVPDYAEIDAADEWKAWLAQDDEHSQLQRQELLDRHVGALDATKVAKMFQSYKASKAPPAPPVAPRGTGNAPSGELPAPAAEMARPLTAAEKRDFYKRSALGKVKDPERKEFEARLKLHAGR
jgi:hypothetical protein